LRLTSWSREQLYTTPRWQGKHMKKLQKEVAKDGLFG